MSRLLGNLFPICVMAFVSLTPSSLGRRPACQQLGGRAGKPHVSDRGCVQACPVGQKQRQHGALVPDQQQDICRYDRKLYFLSRSCERLSFDPLLSLCPPV